MVFATKYAGPFLNAFPKFKDSVSLKEAIDFFSHGSELISANAIFSGLTNYVCEEFVCNNIYTTFRPE